MEEWETLMAGKAFITDLGEDKGIPGDPALVGRYAVWLPIPLKKRHQVVEVGSELEPLMKKHGIPWERVCRAAG